MDLATIISVANIILLLALGYIYLDTFRKTKAYFTIGLIFFSSFFLMQNIIAVYSYITMSSFFAEGIYSIVLLMNLAQFIGLLILLKTSL